MRHLSPYTLEPYRKQHRSPPNACLIPRVELDKGVKFVRERFVRGRDIDIIGGFAIHDIACGGSCRGGLNRG